MTRTAHIVVLVALLACSGSAGAAEPAPAPEPPAAAQPATPPPDAAQPGKDGKSVVGEESDEDQDLPPGERGSADNNISFPVDI